MRPLLATLTFALAVRPWTSRSSPARKHRPLHLPPGVCDAPALPPGTPTPTEGPAPGSKPGCQPCRHGRWGRTLGDRLGRGGQRGGRRRHARAGRHPGRHGHHRSGDRRGGEHRRLSQHRELPGLRRPGDPELPADGVRDGQPVRPAGLPGGLSAPGVALDRRGGDPRGWESERRPDHRAGRARRSTASAPTSSRPAARSCSTRRSHCRSRGWRKPSTSPWRTTPSP